MPDVSVVIPARNAAATLPRTLDALAAQSRNAGDVIVVDDRSTDATAALAEAHDAVTMVVRLGEGVGGVAKVSTNGDGQTATTATVATERSGPGAARNAGARIATGPVLAFTDADCFPRPDWLERAVDALDDADLVQGRVTPERPPGPYDRTVYVDAHGGLFETANLLITRELFDRLGGFEPGWTPAGGKELGEDTWLGWRARRLGARVAFAPDAVVEHAVIPRGAPGYIAERRRLAAFPAMVDRVPELRSALCWRRPFLTKRSAAFDAAAVGVLTAAITRRPAALALAVPYLTQRPRPAQTAADAVGAAALRAGSVRARRLLLGPPRVARARVVTHA